MSSSSPAAALEPATPDVPAATSLRGPGPRLVRGLAATVVLLMACGAAAWWWQLAATREDTDDAYVGGDVTVVGSKVPGYLVELRVTDNQFVHGGDVLARVDGRDYRAVLAKAGAALETQQAALANLAASADLQDALIRRARAGVDAAVAEESRASKDFDRKRDLASRSVVSVESAQAAEAAYGTAHANVAKARAEVQAAERQLAVIAAQRQEAQAAIDQSRAQRELAALDVGFTEIRAPRDGYVGNRRAREGAYLQAGSSLLSLVPAKGLWVDANFKEDQIARMRIGQSVDIHADAWPGESLHGHVASIAPATGAIFSVIPAENATGNFTKIVQRVPVRIALDHGDDALGRLRPGLSVAVRVHLKNGSSAAAVTDDGAP